MRLLMVSGDRQTPVGEKGPFHSMQAEFSRYFERIDVLCPRPPAPPTVSCIHERVHFHPASCGRTGMAKYVRRAGEELIARHGHALIVSHDYGWFYNGFGSAALSRRTGVPYVSEIHHVPGVPVAANARERFDRLVARTYVRWARTRAKAFRVVNEIEMPALLRSWGVSDAQIAVLPSLYIDLELFSPPVAQVEPERDVLFVGRMVVNKGLERIVDALALCKQRGRERTALFLGRGPLRAATEARAARLGLGESVRFLDWVETPADLARLYRTSRACVCASTCEGGPRVTVEAMACGTPAISTPVGVMGEILETGSNGALVGFDVESLAAGIDLVLADESRRRTMGANARKTAERFEYASVIRRYAEGLIALAGRSS